MGLKEPLNLMEFQKMFSTEDACCQHLFQMRWPEGFCCPKCGHKKYYFVEKRRLYECSNCSHQTSLTANTIMHKTRKSLMIWFWMIYLVSHDKRGISATRLATELTISYPTAWLMLHKIRKAMSDRDSQYMLAGIVEMDEAYFGTPTEGGKRGRGTDKIPVAVGVSLNKDGRPRYAKFTVLDNIKADTLLKIAQETIVEGSTISADLYRSYCKLKQAGYVLEAKKYNPKENADHLKWLHTIVANCKAFIQGTYHGLDSKHLQSYLHEFSYRFNRRHFIGQWFKRLLTACISTETITYRRLIGIPDVS